MTGRRVQVTEFGVRGDAAAAGAHGDERAVAALAPGADAVEVAAAFAWSGVGAAAMWPVAKVDSPVKPGQA